MNKLKIFVFGLLLFLLFASTLQTLSEEKKLYLEIQNLQRTTKQMTIKTKSILPTLTVSEQIDNNLDSVLDTLKKSNNILKEISSYLNLVISHTTIINKAITSITGSTIKISKGAHKFSVILELLNKKNDLITKANLEFLKNLGELTSIGSQLESQLEEVNFQMSRPTIQYLINNFKKLEKKSIKLK